MYFALHVSVVCTTEYRYSMYLGLTMALLVTEVGVCSSNFLHVPLLLCRARVLFDGLSLPAG